MTLVHVLLWTLLGLFGLIFLMLALLGVWFLRYVIEEFEG